MGADTSSTSSRTTASSEENAERGNWSGRLDFLMSCISYAVGLGNIWRFPYLCYRNGGAVFLIPYTFFLLLCGIPLFFMEVSYGQFASLSPITVWKISPLFKGVGYGMVIISGIVCIYYNIIITWTLYYLFQSFHSQLPWSTCDNEWNTPHCMLHHETLNDTSLNASYGGLTSHGSLNIANLTAKKTTPSEEFWERKVLGLSSGIEDMGHVRLELLGCLALAWILVFVCLIKGIKSSGRIVYFTATFPYLVLLSLLIRGATLPGAIDGMRFYLIPRWEKLLELKFAMFQCVISSFCDEFKFLLNKRMLVTIGLCIAEFLLGIPCVMQGGIYYLQIMDWYSSTFSLMIISFVQLLVLAWIYGVTNFYDDIEVMIGFRPCRLWKAMWCVVTPVVILFVFMFNVVSHTPVTYGDYQYPGWAIGLGWVYALCSIVPLPLLAIIKYCRTPAELGPLERLRQAARHTEDWGPALDRHRQEWQDFKKDRRALECRGASAHVQEQEMTPFSPPPRYEEVQRLTNVCTDSELEPLKQYPEEPASPADKLGSNLV